MSKSKAHTLAENYAYDLYNDADHVDSLVQNARADLDGGNYASALEFLELAKRPASLLEMRLRDTIAAVKAAQAEGGGS